MVTLFLDRVALRWISPSLAIRSGARCGGFRRDGLDNHLLISHGKRRQLGVGFVMRSRERITWRRRRVAAGLARHGGRRP